MEVKNLKNINKTDMLDLLTYLVKQIVLLKKANKNNLEVIKKFEMAEIKGEEKVNPINKEMENVKSDIREIKQKYYNNKAICFGMNLKVTGEIPTLQGEKTSDRLGTQLEEREGSHGNSKLKKNDQKELFIKCLEEKGVNKDVMKNIISTYEMKTTNEDKIKPVVCVFRDTYQKVDFIKEINKVMKEKKMKTRAVEMLSRENRILLAEVKVALMDKVKFIWTKHGRVLVKKEVGGSTQWIKNSNHIKHFLEMGNSNQVQAD